ncbi:hypothetical protein ABZP36_014836 [Zizania latifolia]
MDAAVGEIQRVASMRESGSMWRRGNDVFQRSSREEDDEEALRWAALEKLPTYDRLRRAILPLDEDGEVVADAAGAGKGLVDILGLGPRDRRALVERLVRVADEDNERFLLKLKDRVERVGIDMPTIEVRFEHLEAEAEVRVGNSGLPTVLNSIINTLEEAGNALHLLPNRKRTMPILHNVSGIIKPRRMSLLLGPPGSGKTTLLLALAGRLDKDLKAAAIGGQEANVITDYILKVLAPFKLQRASLSTASNQTLGVQVLESRGLFPEAKWYWIGFGALLGFTMLFNALFTLALTFLKRDVTWAATFFRRNKALIKELSQPTPGSSDLYFPTKYSQSFFTQCLACLWKQNLSYWRNPPYNTVRFFFTTIIALIFGTIFWDDGRKVESSQDLFDAMGSMYAAVLFIGVMNCTSVQPVVAVERTVFYRERAAGMYSAFPYAFGQVVIELPYTLAQATLYGIIVYAMIAFEWTAAKFFWYLFFMYFTLLYFTYYGMMAVGITPNYHIASIVSAAFYAIWNLFSGFIIPRPRVPIWWRWYCWVCPVAWTLYGLVVSQFGDNETLMEDQTPVKVFVEDYFGFKHSWLGWVAAVVAAFALLFASLFGIAIMKFNFQNR